MLRKATRKSSESTRSYTVPGSRLCQSLTMGCKFKVALLPLIPSFNLHITFLKHAERSARLFFGMRRGGRRYPNVILHCQLIRFRGLRHVRHSPKEYTAVKFKPLLTICTILNVPNACQSGRSVWLHSHRTDAARRDAAPSIWQERIHSWVSKLTYHLRQIYRARYSWILRLGRSGKVSYEGM